MATIDTNVLVRFLTKDDSRQYQRAHQLFECSTLFIPDTVMLETEWVLRYAYGFDPGQVCSAFEKLGGLPTITLQNPMQIHQAIQWHRAGLDFADALHLAHSEGNEPFYSFDKKLLKRAPGCDCTPVIEP